MDGYASYEKLPGVTLIGCWAYARRKFLEAIQVLPVKERKQGGTPSHVGLDYCNQLFDIKRDLKDATAEDRLAARLQRSQAVLILFRA